MPKAKSGGATSPVKRIAMASDEANEEDPPVIKITGAWGNNSVRVDPWTLPVKWDVPTRPVPHVAVPEPHDEYYGKTYALHNLHIKVVKDKGA